MKELNEFRERKMDFILLFCGQLVAYMQFIYLVYEKQQLLMITERKQKKKKIKEQENNLKISSLFIFICFVFLIFVIFLK